MKYFISFFFCFLIHNVSLGQDNAEIYKWEARDFSTLSRDIVRGEATMEGAYQVKCLPRPMLEALLPKSLKLVKTNLCSEGLHPALFFFGAQKNLRAVNKIGSISFSSKYNESVMGLFSVGYSESPERFFYVPQIKVDSIAAWLFAQPYGGLNKHLAKFKVTNNQMMILNRDETEVLSSISWNPRQVSSKFAMSQHFARLQPYFKDRVIAKLGYGFTCFKFDWNFKLERMIPGVLKFQLSENYVSPLLKGLFNDGIALNQSPLGAFFASNDWQMQLPHSCK